MGWLKSEYKSTWRFYKENMKVTFPLLLIGFVLIGVAAHYVLLSMFSKDSNLILSVYNEIMDSLSGIDIVNDSNFVSFVKLFFNNSKVALIAVVIGVIPFLFLPVFIYFVNGGIIGALSSIMAALGTLNMSFFLAAILPHGILEIPAIVYSCALGLWLCRETTRKLFGKSDKPFGKTVMDVLRNYCLVVLPLLLVAAFIEAFLTVHIASMFI